MSVKQFADDLKSEVVRCKEEGAESINCDSLIGYLGDVVESTKEEPTETELAEYRAKWQLHIEQTRSYSESQLEMFRAVITSGQTAIRSSFLMNGGAAVALLAFIGHLAANDSAHVGAFADALSPFVWGVLVVSVVSGFTYLSQWFYYSDSKLSQLAGLFLNICSIVLGLASYGLFIRGLDKARCAFMLFS